MEIKIFTKKKSGPYIEINFTDDKFWDDSSIFIEDEIFSIFEKIITENASNFNPYGNSTIIVTKKSLSILVSIKSNLKKSISKTDFISSLQNLSYTSALRVFLLSIDKDWFSIKESLITFLCELIDYLKPYIDKKVYLRGI